MIRKVLTVMAGTALLGALLMAPATPAAAQGKKLILAIPGIPPIFSVTIAYVAQKEGFFKKHGADVEIKPFDNGTAAARAVISGDMDMAFSPTPPVINQISNAGVPLVAVYGMPNPDWVLGTTEAGKTCKDVVRPGSRRQLDRRRALGGAALHAHRLPGREADDVKQVALGSSTAPAMIAGKLHFGVLHLDDVAVIEQQGKKLEIAAGDEEHQSDQPLSDAGGAQG